MSAVELLSAELRLADGPFTLSTADEERNVVVDQGIGAARVRPMGVQPGQYRVIDGVLCRIVDALPPTWPVTVLPPHT
jgi:hypothetical protein